MKIPKQITIIARKIDIVYDKTLYRREDVHITADYRKDLIVLDDSISIPNREVRKINFLDMTLKWIFTIMRYPEYASDNITGLFANLLYQAICQLEKDYKCLLLRITPWHIKLMGRQISVEYDKNLFEKTDSIGLAIYRENKIKLYTASGQDGLTDQKLELTYWHELTHWLFYLCNHKDNPDQNEDLVERVSLILHQIFPQIADKN